MCLKDGEPANHPHAHTQLNGAEPRQEATAGPSELQRHQSSSSRAAVLQSSCRWPELAPSGGQTLSPASFFDCARSTSIRLSSYSFCMLAT